MLPPVRCGVTEWHPISAGALTCAFERTAGSDDGGAEPQQDAAVEAYDEFDPWAPLDMHEPGTLLVRPFRKVISGQRASKCLSATTPSGDCNWICCVQSAREP